MKRGQKVKVIRSEITDTVAEWLGNFVFCNYGSVVKTKDGRVQVKFANEKYWFDADQLELVA